MGKKKSLFFLCFFLVFNHFLLQAQGKREAVAYKIKIITSVFPLFEIAKAVAGERGEVSLLLPPNAEVHTWQPTASDIIKLSSADLFIYVGESLEPWLHDILRSVMNPKLKVLEASKDLSLIVKNEDTSLKHEEKVRAHSHGDPETHIDPHIWLDFDNDRIIVDRIEDFLSKIAPEGAVLFKENALAYKKKLQQLDEKYKQALSDCQVRTFIVGGHEAFGYLAKKYRLQQISLYGLSPDSKPSPRQLIEIVELARQYKIGVIYFESYISDKLAKVIAKEVGAKTLVLNAGANITRDQLKTGITFLEIMEKNLENLKNGLKCR